MTRCMLCLGLLFALAAGAARAGDGNRLAYLDEVNPYYPSRTFPKLTTPMWVGEDGVDAVVILAIDDMRGHEKWEQFLRPILNRLKKIDGRAPVSIMTCQIDPKHPHLQQWLKEGLSLEVHTIDHPCPLLQKGDLAKAKSTYDRCVDLLNEVPGNKPVAFRMPCCDSLNTLSPRFFTEIFNKTTDKKNFLTLDSSVFQLFTANDPDLPRDLVFDPDGRERFRKYLPADRSFVNTIEDYPYPYVIGRLCWEFPCMTPSDWQAQHLHKPNNSITVRDWQAALDCTVIKKGVFSFVFHPHGWIKAEQLIDFIDYAQAKYGKRVKFLTFKEAQERLNKNVLGSYALRDPNTGTSNGLTDFGGGGWGEWSISFFDKKRGVHARWWNSANRQWISEHMPHWTDAPVLRPIELSSSPSHKYRPHGTWIRRTKEKDEVVIWSDVEPHFRSVGLALPPNMRLGDDGYDTGLRLIDLDGDGNDDVIFSNEKEYGVYLFSDMEHGWSRKVIAGKQGEPGAIPPIAINGKNNGFWVHSRSLWWQNENTAHLKDHVDRRSFNELLANVEPQAKSPEASLKSIQVKPGFLVELMAAEPLVQSPIAFAFGPDGKLWVVEMGDYPLGIDGKGKPGGRVKFLESTKDDGKYDKATVFLDNLPFPTGVLPWRNGILVTCAPDIFFVQNDNGKPGKKEILFTGFGQGNQQHRVNSLVWGLDNWIYVANGDSGGKITSKKTGKTIDISGRDLRINPDTGEMETQAGQTQYGRSRDDWGNWFGGNNSYPMWHFILDDHYLRRNPHIAAPDARGPVATVPGVAPVYPISRTLPRFNDFFAANRFTSACSPIVYRDTLYGKWFENNTFVSEPVHNLIHREIMTPTGVTFRSQRALDERQSEFLASTDNWFRPTMIQTGPDGCLWIADMYRHVIEHPEWIPKDWQKRLDLRAGHDKGRIYRVVPVGVKPRAIPRLDKLDTAGLVAALDSPNGWQRDMAQMMLYWRNDPRGAQPLMNLYSTSKSPLTRMQALCALHATSSHILFGLSLRRAFEDPHPGVRRHAVRLAEPIIPSSSTLQEMLPKLADDPDPQVRLQLAYLLGEWNDPSAGQLLGKLAHAAVEDRYLFAAVLSSVNRNNLDAVLRAALGASKAPAPRLIEAFLNIASALGQTEATTTLLETLAQPTEGRFTPGQQATLADVLDALEQRGKTLTAAQSGKIGELIAAARKTALDEKLSAAERAGALRLFAREPERRKADVEMLVRFLAPQSPPELQAGAVAALGRQRDADLAKLLLRGWKGYGPARRAQVVELLLRRDDGTRAILAALDEKQIDPSEIDAPARQRLRTHKDVAVRARAEKILTDAVSPDRQKVIDDFRSALTLKGDAAKGRAVFEKACAACHRLNNVGNEVGPDLAALQNRSSEYLLIAILDPNRAVEARYVQYIAETKNGVTLTGVLLNETSTSVTIVGTDGKPQTILRTNLESLTSTGRSAMPEGLEKDLKAQDLSDLLAHMHASRPALKPKAFEGNVPITLKPNPDGTMTLSAINAEIYGPTLVLEKQYANLGYWSHADDHAVWSVAIPKAGKYEVWLNWACPEGNAGNSFTLETDGGTVPVRVISTGSWDVYKQVKLGEISLSPGEQRIVVRPDGAIAGGALMDLKSLRLVPVK